MKIKYLAACILLTSARSFAASGTMPNAIDADPRPDNTTVNHRDRSENAVTADQQKNNKSDLKITQMIRKDIMADKNLSTYAHNVKIIAVDGKVTLRGPVRSEDEKSKIAVSATRVAGNDNVVNDLEIKQ